MSVSEEVVAVWFRYMVVIICDCHCAVYSHVYFHEPMKRPFSPWKVQTYSNTCGDYKVPFLLELAFMPTKDVGNKVGQSLTDILKAKQRRQASYP